MTSMLTRIAMALTQAREENGWPILNLDPDFHDYPLTRDGTDDTNPFTEGDVLALAKSALEAMLEPDEGMIRLGLAVRWPATYREYLRHPDSGPRTIKQTEDEITEMYDQWQAMIHAALEATP